MLTYVIGDVHGCFGLLRQALLTVRRHSRGSECALVLLGDLIDRGPDSRKVVETLMALRNGGRTVCLKGNHEDLLLRYLSGCQRSGAAWLTLGGGATLASYGLEASRLSAAHDLPASHVAWLVRRPVCYPTLDRIYVHAGIRPELPLERQSAIDWLWIRQPFLGAEPSSFIERRHVVHGHTPQWSGKPVARTPELRPNRTNLDTGGYITGVLAIGVFEPGRPGPLDVLEVVD